MSFRNSLIDVQGKSLSLICGSLTWLREAQEAALTGIEDAEGLTSV